MERLLWHVVDQLRDEYEIHVIGPKGCKKNLPEGVTADEVGVKNMVSFLIQSLWHCLRQAYLKRADIVMAGSGLTAPVAWGGSLLSRGRSMVYLHGLDVSPPSRLYKMLWHPVLRRMDKVIVNSHFTREMVMGIGIPQKKIFIVHPGVELPDMSKSKQKAAAFREQYALGNDPFMLYVGRITRRKGLAYFIEYIFPKIVDKMPGSRLIVIGGIPQKALLKEKNEMADVKAAIEKGDVSEKVFLLGETDDQTLSAAYFSANVLVFPLRDLPGNPEGFGMVALEAAAHGLPTVAFASGGVTDAVRVPESGDLVLAQDADAFSEAVVRRLQSQDDSTVKKCRDVAGAYVWAVFGSKLKAVVQSLEN
jgi:phosphatidylinositol alpha-1,6-mannosyltransferase